MNSLNLQVNLFLLCKFYCSYDFSYDILFYHFFIIILILSVSSIDKDKLAAMNSAG